MKVLKLEKIWDVNLNQRMRPKLMVRGMPKRQGRERNWGDRRMPTGTETRRGLRSAPCPLNFAATHPRENSVTLKVPEDEHRLESARHQHRDEKFRLCVMAG